MQPENSQTTAPTPAVDPVQPVVEADPRDQAADTELLEPGEHLVTVVHRSPIGLMIIYFEAMVVLVALASLMIFLAPNFISNLSGQSYWLFLSGVLLVVTLLVLVLLVATYIYRQSRLVVSDKSLIQIIQKGLFNRKISRLSMSNVQDVCAQHQGVLSTMFGFGMLTIETAGEEDNFAFPYCPSPDAYAARVLNTRQNYVQNLDEANRAGDSG